MHLLSCRLDLIRLGVDIVVHGHADSRQPFSTQKEKTGMDCNENEDKYSSGEKRGKKPILYRSFPL